MATKNDKEKHKLAQEKCQSILADLLRDEDNKYCVDCDAKGPRWASWNLGIFLCIRCAGIHRNLGVHISKVKSVNLDAWTPEQIACLQHMGNSKARAVYEANLPDNFRRPQTDSSLEAFIRAKYEQKKYIAKEWVQPPPPKPAFDIDEEMRKEKERKRNKSKIVSATSSLEVQSSPLPRPHSNPALINTDKIPQDVGKKQETEMNFSCDLLGLDVNNSSLNSNNAKSDDDAFGVFVSSPLPSSDAKENSGSTMNDNKDDEEALFFNQKAPDEKKIMSKESILSLYGSNTSAPPPPQPLIANTPQQIPFANNQSMFMAPFSVSGVPPQHQSGVFLPQNNVAPVMPNSMMQTSNQMSQSLFPLTTNPFLANNSTSSLGQPALTQLPHQMTGLQLGPTPVSLAANMPQANNDWLSSGQMNAANNIPIPPAGLINPFMSAPPLIHAGVPMTNNFAGVGVNPGIFAQQATPTQWNLSTNQSLPQQGVTASSNLWQ